MKRRIIPTPLPPYPPERPACMNLPLIHGRSAQKNTSAIKVI